MNAAPYGIPRSETTKARRIAQRGDEPPTPPLVPGLAAMHRDAQGPRGLLRIRVHRDRAASITGALHHALDAAIAGAEEAPLFAALEQEALEVAMAPVDELAHLARDALHGTLRAGDFARRSERLDEVQVAAHAANA